MITAYQPPQKTRTAEAEAPPASLRFFLYLFCFSICFQNFNPFGIANFTISKLIGMMLFIVALRHYRICFRINSFVMPCFIWILTWNLIVSVYYESNLSYLQHDLSLTGLSFTQNICFFWIASNLFSNLKTAWKALWWFAAGCTVMSVLMPLGIGTTLALEGREQLARISFLGSNANEVGIWLGCAALLLVGSMFENYHGWGWRRWLLFPVLALIFYSLAHTGSRGCLLAMIVSIPMFLFVKTIKKKLYLLIAIFIISLVLGGYVASSEILLLRFQRTIEKGDLGARDVLAKRAWTLFKEKPVFGWGYDAGLRELTYLGSKFNDSITDTHNGFMWSLVTSGLVGFIPFVYIIFRILYSAFSARHGPLGCLPLAVTVLIDFNLVKGGGCYLQKTTWVFLAFSLASAACRSQAFKSTALLHALAPGLPAGAPGSARPHFTASVEHRHTAASAGQ